MPLPPNNLTAMSREILQLSHDQTDFPISLKNIYQPPKVLWYQGNIQLASRPNLLAVVGSRQASWYGRLAIGQLLVPAILKELIIVSGLAIGIDTLAHQAALAANRPTIAILGSGLSVSSLYPPSNWQLAQRIVENGGLLLSEYLPGDQARPYYFPQRNRLIAGLSAAVLVVEAAQKSGALITAKLALQEGRDVLAVPGNINQPLSVGPNQLIQLGAYPISQPKDLTVVLDLPESNSYSETSSAITTEQSRLLKFLDRPLGLDDLAEIAGQPISQITGQLTDLEIAGLIQQQADNTYVACSLKKLCV